MGEGNIEIEDYKVGNSRELTSFLASLWEARQVPIWVPDTISTIEQSGPFRKTSELRKSIVK